MARTSTKATLGEYVDNLDMFSHAIGDADSAYVTVGEIKALVKFARDVMDSYTDPDRSWTEIKHALDNLEGTVTF